MEIHHKSSPGLWIGYPRFQFQNFILACSFRFNRHYMIARVSSPVAFTHNCLHYVHTRLIKFSVGRVHVFFIKCSTILVNVYIILKDTNWNTKRINPWYAYKESPQIMIQTCEWIRIKKHHDVRYANAILYIALLHILSYP